MNLCFLILSTFFLTLSTAQTDKLQIELLYESLCPDSLRFVNEQLYPVAKELATYLDILYVPFGKSASLNNGSQFTCQHGPRECLGNRVMSCGLSYLTDFRSQLEYVQCFMNVFKKDTNFHQLGQSCIEALGVSWNVVAQCIDGPQGTQLQLQAEQETARFAPKFIPTIVYNGAFNQKAQDDSLVNFREVVCSYLRQLYPEACNNYFSVLQL